jgi:hypothetical protein
MANVTFTCTCPQSVVNLQISQAAHRDDVTSITFQQSGSNTVQLASGAYDAGYRVQGTAGTNYSVTATGATLNPAIGGQIPAGGVDAGVAGLTVA